MAFGPKDSERAARLGTTSPHPIEYITHGRVRKRTLGSDAIDEWLIVDADPAAPPPGRAYEYYRSSGGKVQKCVRFPSGAIQILVTEP